MMETVNCEYSEIQLAFVSGRGTVRVAAPLGTPVLWTQAERLMLYHTIPHSGISCTPSVTHCWRMQVYWYGRLMVQVKWDSRLSKAVNV